MYYLKKKFRIRVLLKKMSWKNVQYEIQILEVILPMTFSKICLPTLESTADRGSSSRYTSALLYTARARLKKIRKPKLYTPSTLNIDLILWHTHLIVCAEKWITHDLIHDFHFTFQAYIPCPIHWMVHVLAYLDFILEP